MFLLSGAVLWAGARGWYSFEQSWAWWPLGFLFPAVNALASPPPRRNVFAAVGWIALAAGLVLANLGYLHLRLRDLVPLALVAFGARLLYRARTLARERAMRSGRRTSSAQALAGLLLLTVGSLLFAQNLDLLNVRQYWRYWPAIPLAIGLLKLLSGGSRGDQAVRRRADDLRRQPTGRGARLLVAGAGRRRGAVRSSASAACSSSAASSDGPRQRRTRTRRTRSRRLR